jgi:hypothetical protein
MKGLYVMLNQELLDFLWEARKEVDDVYTDELNDKDPGLVLRRLGERGWTYEKDRFGEKQFKSIQYPASTPPQEDDELRVTVVLKRNALYLDIRPWGTY